MKYVVMIGRSSKIIEVNNVQSLYNLLTVIKPADITIYLEVTSIGIVASLPEYYIKHFTNDNIKEFLQQSFYQDREVFHLWTKNF